MTVLKVTLCVNAAAWGYRKQPPSFLCGLCQKKTWSCFINCKIRDWSTAAFALWQYAPLALEELPCLKHVVNLFVSLLRQSRAVKYFDLMRRARGQEMGRQANVCETAKNGSHFWGYIQHFCWNRSTEQEGEQGRSWVNNWTDGSPRFKSVLRVNENLQRKCCEIKHVFLLCLCEQNRHCQSCQLLMCHYPCIFRYNIVI